MCRLASSYNNVGFNELAADLERAVLSTRVQILGPEHLDTLDVMSKLAVTYNEQVCKRVPM